MRNEILWREKPTSFVRPVECQEVDAQTSGLKKKKTRKEKDLGSQTISEAINCKGALCGSQLLKIRFLDIRQDQQFS